MPADRKPCSQNARFWKRQVGGYVGVGWGGMLTFLVVRTLDVATLQRSLVLLLRYRLLRCRDLKHPKTPKFGRPNFPLFE